jgi:hypothetical protein
VHSERASSKFVIQSRKDTFDTVLALLKKGRQSASGEGRKPPDICPGATTIVAPKSVCSRTTNGQMKVISLGGRRDGPNHADRLDRASRGLSARMPRKKPQAKKSPSVLSVEPAYELTVSEASQRTKPAQNHFPDASHATAISHFQHGRWTRGWAGVVRSKHPSTPLAYLHQPRLEGFDFHLLIFGCQSHKALLSR